MVRILYATITLILSSTVAFTQTCTSTRFQIVTVDSTGSGELLSLDTSHENAYVLSEWSSEIYNDNWDPVFSLESGTLSVTNEKTGEKLVTNGPNSPPTSNIVFSSPETSNPSRLFCDESSGMMQYDGHSDLWSVCSVGRTSPKRVILYNASELVAADDSEVISSCTSVKLAINPMDY